MIKKAIFSKLISFSVRVIVVYCPGTLKVISMPDLNEEHLAHFINNAQ